MLHALLRLAAQASVAILVLGCGSSSDTPAPAPTATSAPSSVPETRRALADRVEGLFLSTTGADTERTDETLRGPSTEIAALSPLPAVRRTGTREPGGALHPAVFIELDHPVTGAELGQAYSQAYDALDGMNGWFPLAQTDDGWRDFVTGDDVTTSTRIACGIDLIGAIELEDDTDDGLVQLARGCEMIATSLHGRIGPPLDAAAIRARARAMTQAYDAHGRVTLRVISDSGIPVTAAYGALRALGFVRSDFGALAWYTNLELGDDRLLVADLGAYADSLGADDRTNAVDVDLDLGVPMPELVAAAAWRTLESIAAGTPARITWVDGRVETPITREAFDRRIAAALVALRAVGFHSDYERIE